MMVTRGWVDFGNERAEAVRTPMGGRIDRAAGVALVRTSVSSSVMVVAVRCVVQRWRLTTSKLSGLTLRDVEHGPLTSTHTSYTKSELDILRRLRMHDCYRIEVSGSSLASLTT